MDSRYASPLHELADHFGVLPFYYDISGRRVEAKTDVLLPVLTALGLEVRNPENATKHLEERQRKKSHRLLDTVYAVAAGTQVVLSLPNSGHSEAEAAELRLKSESGDSKEGRPTLQSDSGGVRLALPWTLEAGYHLLTLRRSDREETALLICSPGPIPRDGSHLSWGISFPLYGLESNTTWGAGDFSTLNAAVRWMEQLGGDIAGTLPILAAAPDSPDDPSPYAPWSRLFWNDFYVDVEQIPEFRSCAEAQRIIASANFQTGLKEVRENTLVRYAEIDALKRSVLSALCDHFFRQKGSRREQLDRFVSTRPLLRDFAASRARRSSEKGAGENYHLFVQWLAETQVMEVAEQARRSGVRLLLDYPLSVARDGFDAAAFPESFVPGVSLGAPPDYFFSQGQNWGLPPLHPEMIRAQHYRYFRLSLAHQLRLSPLLRVDHVMGFHRMFWIPEGCDAKDGVYVRYPAEEFYAMLCLEARRHHAWIVGEDLGTVPPEVRPAMRRHGVLRSYVAQVEDISNMAKSLESMPEDCVASLNTHDMPSFAAFWGERPSPGEALRSHLTALAAGPAAVVLANLEDLWLEKEPQNVPGTSGSERPNWKRKLKFKLEEIRRRPEVLSVLGEVKQHRRRSAKSKEVP